MYQAMETLIKVLAPIQIRADPIFIKKKKDKWRNKLEEKNYIRINNKDKKPACFSGDSKKTFVKVGTNNATGRVNFLTGKGKRKKYLGVVVK